MEIVTENGKEVVIERHSRSERLKHYLLYMVLFFVFVVPFLAFQRYKVIDNCYVFYNYYNYFNNAYVSEVMWDGNIENVEFTVPDMCGIHKVRTLGGPGGHSGGIYFCVQPNEELSSQGYRIWDDDY